jgi:Ca2+-binding EF-hand superfamily protein
VKLCLFCCYACVAGGESAGVCCEQDAKALFDFMDKDNSGFVTPDELREWLEASTGTSVMDMQAAPGDALPLYSDTA